MKHAAATLDHPNIVRAFDVGMQREGESKFHLMVMEYVDGRDLDQEVNAVDPLPVRQAAPGLAHEHSAGMIHRNIKPSNLLVDRDGTLKILDLGLARFGEDELEDSLTVTFHERVLGTADYLSPEQILDSLSVDARSDIYGLGCTFYCMLTGHPPFTDGNVAQRLFGRQLRRPPPITARHDDVPVDVVAIFDRMLEKNRMTGFKVPWNRPTYLCSSWTYHQTRRLKRLLFWTRNHAIASPLGNTGDPLLRRSTGRIQ